MLPTKRHSQRSPKPMSVPWTWTAPERTAAREFAVASPASLCAWMPRGTPNTAAARVAVSMSQGRVPPLVSQRTRHSAPASAAAFRPAVATDADSAGRFVPWSVVEAMIDVEVDAYYRRAS